MREFINWIEDNNIANIAAISMVIGIYIGKYISKEKPSKPIKNEQYK